MFASKTHWLVAWTISAFVVGLVPSDLFAQKTIPGHTSYVHPDPWGARIRENQGVLKWQDSNPSIRWWGLFKNPGELGIKVLVRGTAESVAGLKLRVGDQEHSSVGTSSEQEFTIVDFGRFELKIDQPSHQMVELVRGSGEAIDVKELRLDGPASVDAFFNLKERRNAASVHLMYPVDRQAKVEAFYTEVVGVEEPIGTFYMACGWHRGYFGMQVNSKTERRIIFSVWDSGNEAIDRNKVAKENRVQLIGKGEGVFAGDFGNEGTGGHSHLKVLWKTGAKQRFLVTAVPTDATHTTFSGYWFHPEDNKWMLISSWNAPKEGGYMRGLHSFSENFLGENGHLVRKALYGNQWYRTSDGKWHEITEARFSHDPTGKEDRMDRTMGVEDNQFFLRHGGFLDGSLDYGTPMTRDPVGQPPSDIEALLGK
ncbi:MAG: DUF3472 domain-containing protein [Planctomycetota bacterium]|jgi:hypothetical protein